jgi:hypothetical protein
LVLAVGSAYAPNYFALQAPARLRIPKPESGSGHDFFTSTLAAAHPISLVIAGRARVPQHRPSREDLARQVDSLGAQNFSMKASARARVPADECGGRKRSAVSASTGTTPSRYAALGPVSHCEFPENSADQITAWHCSDSNTSTVIVKGI